MRPNAANTKSTTSMVTGTIKENDFASERRHNIHRTGFLFPETC
jgi:hypothetical protein